MNARLSRRVLIVDDDADFRHSLAELLRGDGHDVRCARDGRQALAEAAAWLPDIVLLDIFMPGQTGFVTARKLREACPVAGMTLVMTSAAELDETTLAQAGDAGFDRCIDKTRAHDALCAILEQHTPTLH